MLIDGRKLTQATSINADICIMGAGVAGITLANELGKLYSNIVLIESGSEEYDPQTYDLYKSATQSKEYRRDTQHSRVRMLGGSSNHWANNTSPFSPIDFEKRDWIDNSGWPITFNDIKPFYLPAAKYCGTNQDSYSTEYWRNYFKEQNILKDNKLIELAVAKAAIPPVNFYRNYGKQLKSSKNITIYKNSNIVDLSYDIESQRITQASFNCFNEYTHTVSAKHFIMCFGGLENARMLLYFNRKYNNKLGNQFDNVGRYFMDHPGIRAALLHTSDELKLKNLQQQIESRFIVRFFQLSKDTLVKNQTCNIRIPLSPIDEYTISDGVASFHALKDAISQGDMPEHFGTHISNLVMDIDMVIEAISRKSFNKRLFDNADNFAGYQSDSMMEQTPHRDNRIILTDQLDALKIPRLDIEWEIKQQDKDMAWKSLEIFARGIGAESLGRVRLLREREDQVFGSQLSFGDHHMGTTRMANSEKEGVVDKNLKVFGTKNLYIGGSSVFTTGGHVPPTLTITALSIRLAEYLKKEILHG